jgi:hypothetical protein
MSMGRERNWGVAGVGRGKVERRWHCEMGKSHGDFQKAFI